MAGFIFLPIDSRSQARPAYPSRSPAARRRLACHGEPGTGPSALVRGWHEEDR
jgi:hypothetical protein